MSKKPLQQSQTHPPVYPNTREAMPKIRQVESIEVSRGTVCNPKVRGSIPLGSTTS
jgi:hypothetical protein